MNSHILGWLVVVSFLVQGITTIKICFRRRQDRNKISGTSVPIFLILGLELIVFFRDLVTFSISNFWLNFGMMSGLYLTSLGLAWVIIEAAIIYDKIPKIILSLFGLGWLCQAILFGAYTLILLT